MRVELVADAEVVLGGSAMLGLEREKSDVKDSSGDDAQYKDAVG